MYHTDRCIRVNEKTAVHSVTKEGWIDLYSIFGLYMQEVSVDKYTKCSDTSSSDGGRRIWNAEEVAAFCYILVFSYVNMTVLPARQAQADLAGRF